MKLKLFIFIIIGATLIGCSTTKQVTTQLVHDIHTDTVYLSNIQYDSIYIYKDRSMEYYPASSRIGNHSSRIGIDTIYLKDVSVEYRYKLLRDTIKVVQHDSIPFEVTVIETKEITRPLTLFDHLTRAVFWTLCGILFAKLVFCLKKHLL